MWDKQSLIDLVQNRLNNHRMVVVSNREPYIHRYSGDQLECIRPASGMATAIDPVMRACGGVWVGHGSGDADSMTVDSHDHVQVPPEAPEYTLRRVWLTKEEEEHYYYGLSNDGLWPLCHVAFRRPQFRNADWEMYKRVNARFAEAVLEEVGSGPTFVFIQDYHLALLPRLLKSARPDLIVAQFWHIPWPNREIFRAFPWKEQLLDGLLGNDLLGFHLRYHCQNFLDTIDRTVEARVDQEHATITRKGKDTKVRPFPISVDAEEHQRLSTSNEVAELMTSLRRRYGLRDELLGIGIDRLDYTKGIPDRLRALDLFLEAHPEFRQRLVFLQVGIPTRSHLREYRMLEEEIDEAVERLNWKWGSGAWKPVLLSKQHHDAAEMAALHRLAHFCIVSSLHDGMNLVAKEYVANRVDNDGVLILSQFTGSARELTDALVINPFDIDQLSETIYRAVVMPAVDRQRRMRRMREVVSENNIYRWVGKILTTLLRIDEPERVALAIDETDEAAA